MATKAATKAAPQRQPGKRGRPRAQAAGATVAVAAPGSPSPAVPRGEPLLRLIRHRAMVLGLDKRAMAAAIGLSVPYFGLIFVGERWVGGLAPEKLRNIAKMLGISTVAVYLLAEVLQATDLFRESTLDDQLATAYRRLSRDAQTKDHVMPEAAWQRLPVESRIWCALTYQRSLGQQILEPWPRIDVETPTGILKSATPAELHRLKGSLVVDAIRERMEALGLTLGALSDTLELSKPYLSFLLSGQRPTAAVSVPKLRAVARFLDLSKLTVLQLAEIFTSEDLFPSGSAITALDNALDLMGLDATLAHNLPGIEVWSQTSEPGRRLATILYHRARLRALGATP